MLINAYPVFSLAEHALEPQILTVFLVNLGTFYNRAPANAYPLAQAGYYKDTLSSKCSPCHSACLTCFGEDTTQCLSCQSGYFFLQSLSACLSSCPTGYWTDMSKNTCIPCHHSCTSCTGPANTQCSACSSRYYSQPGTTT